MIDFRSDTVTLPSPEMKQAIFDAKFFVRDCIEIY